MRLKGIIGFFVTSFFLSIFGWLFADNVIKGSIEFLGSRANGALVELESLELSFLNLSLDIKGIQVTDKHDVWKNKFEIGDINFKVNMERLIENKVLIENMSIQGIKMDTARGYSGELERSEERSLWTKGTRLVKEEIGELPSLQMLQGKEKVNVDELVKPEKLKTPDEIKKIEIESNQRYETSKSALGNLNVKPRAEEIKKKIDSVNLNQKDILKLQGELKKLKKIKKDTDKLTKDINDANKKVKSDMKYVDDSVKKIDQLKEEDYNSIISAIGDVKSIDEEKIARLAFGQVWFDRAETMLGWFDIAKAIMPEKQENEKKVKEVKASVGSNIEFPKENSYPSFVLNQAAISTESQELAFSGTLNDISSDPDLHGKPATFTIKGTQPQFDLTGTMDRMKGANKDVFTLVLPNVDLKDFDLSNSPLLPTKVSSGKAKVEIQMETENKEIDLNIKVYPRELKFAPEDIPESVIGKEVTHILSTAINIEIEGKIYGSMGSLRLKIKSNIDKLIIKRFNELVNERIEDAKRQIRAKIDSMIEKPKSELLSKLKLNNSELDKLLKDKNALNDQLKNELNSKIKQGESQAQKQAQDKIDKQKDKQKDKLKDKVKDKLKDLLK